VHAKNSIYIIETAFFHIMPGLRANFLCHLEKQFYRTGNFLLMAAENFSCPQQHCGVTVMSTSMHDAGILRNVVLPMIIFLDRQSVNVSSQHHGFSGLCTFNYAYGTGNILKSQYLNSHFLQFFHNMLSGINFLCP